MPVTHLHYRISGRQQEPCAGFTILELMVAASVFTVVLLVIAVGVLSFTNSYVKGINSSKTQAAARLIMDTLVQSIQFGRSISQSSGASGVFGLCIDNTFYEYALGEEVVDASPTGANQAYHGLVAVTGSDCSGATPAMPSTPTLPAGSRELLGQNMRLAALQVTQSGSLYTIHLRLLYGDDDLLTPAPGSGANWASEGCISGRPGSQFCAVSDLTTTVVQRLL